MVFLAAVRALPSELLEALQNAELCDPGILMAYPRGSVELIAPQASRKRFFAKKQSFPHSADQTFTSIPVTCTDTGIPGVGLSYLSTFPLPLSLSSSSLSSVPVVSSSVVSGEKRHEPIPAHGQKTTQRSKELSPDHGQKTAQRSKESRHQSTHTQGSGRSSDFMGSIGVERQSVVERDVYGSSCGGNQGTSGKVPGLMTVNAGKKKKEKIADSSATRLKTTPFSSDFAEISGFSKNPKVKLSVEVTRQVVEMGGVGSNPSSWVLISRVAGCRTPTLSSDLR